VAATGRLIARFRIGLLLVAAEIMQYYAVRGTKFSDNSISAFLPSLSIGSVATLINMLMDVDLGL
jgi:hypothetical protein